MKDRVVELMYNWYTGLPTEGKIAEAYRMLKQQGRNAAVISKKGLISDRLLIRLLFCPRGLLGEAKKYANLCIHQFQKLIGM